MLGLHTESNQSLITFPEKDVNGTFISLPPPPGEQRNSGMRVGWFSWPEGPAKFHAANFST